MDYHDLLIVEDDPGIQKQLKWCFDGYNVHTAGSREEALALLRRHEPSVVLQDLGLPPDAEGVSEGFLTLKSILELAPNTKVIVITGNDDTDNAVRAVGAGAYDFYQKPLDNNILNLVVQRAFHIHQLEARHRALMLQHQSSPIEGIIAVSPPMLQVCRIVEKVAPTLATVLLLGESGTGKELLARAVHRLSPRDDGPFIAINCAAIPETLLESELFGYEKGAFTGATKQTQGKIECASGGTLFLDEIGDMPLPLQAKLLRFLQERVVERLGGRQEIPVDVRVVCATNQNLLELSSERAFREDLYYRVSEVTIEIPPLRERKAGKLVLARAFLERFAQTHNRSIRGFSSEAEEAIQDYDWPGNVREMENKVNSAVIMSDGNRISSLDLGLPESGLATRSLNLREVRDRAEIDAVKDALAITGQNMSRTAELLGITRPTLYSLLKKHGLGEHGAH